MSLKFAVIAHGAEIDKLRFALSAGVALSQKHETSISIIVPTLSNVKNTILSKLLGEEYIKQLLKGKPSTLEGRPVTLSSIRTFNSHSETGVVIGIWGGDKMLSVIDKAVSAKAIIAISWNESDITDWANNDDVKIISEDGV